jgi:Uncharacterized protein related to capsule biosynthesis enzymes
MGALCYQPETQAGQSREQQTLEKYALEVQKILREEDIESLSDWVEKAGSPAGARPKIILEVDGQPWLIKFRASEDPEDIGQLEYEYAKTAQACGIMMPETRLFEGKWFGSRRFDRHEGRRIHCLTASGLLHASHRYPSLDYADLMKATHLVTNSMAEVKKIYHQMVFNVRTRNRDDHAKNFSFMMVNGMWQCSPAYDLVFSDGFGGAHTTTINGKGTPSTQDLIDVGLHAGLEKQECDHIIQKIFDQTYELLRCLPT